MDILSLGRASLFQWAIVAASVSSERTSSPSVMGMPGYRCACVKNIMNMKLIIISD